MKPLSPTQRRCIIDATIEPLRPFRRGFAPTKTGPFYEAQTINALIKTGALRVIKKTKAPIRLSARAE